MHNVSKIVILLSRSKTILKREREKEGCANNIISFAKVKGDKKKKPFGKSAVLQVDFI